LQRCRRHHTYVYRLAIVIKMKRKLWRLSISNALLRHPSSHHSFHLTESIIFETFNTSFALFTSRSKFWYIFFFRRSFRECNNSTQQFHSCSCDLEWKIYLHCTISLTIPFPNFISTSKAPRSLIISKPFESLGIHLLCFYFIFKNCMVFFSIFFFILSWTNFYIFHISNSHFNKNLSIFTFLWISQYIMRCPEC
jgi:hypothetical protein